MIFNKQETRDSSDLNYSLWAVHSGPNTASPLRHLSVILFHSAWVPAKPSTCQHFVMQLRLHLQTKQQKSSREENYQSTFSIKCFIRVIFFVWFTQNIHFNSIFLQMSLYDALRRLFYGAVEEYRQPRDYCNIHWWETRIPDWDFPKEL